jgi:hypothetical protein
VVAAHFHIGRVEPDVGPVAFKRAIEEGLDPGIDLLAQTADVALRDAASAQRSRRVVSAFMATAFAQDSPDAAKAQWRRVADQLRAKLPKLSAFMDEAEDDVLAWRRARAMRALRMLDRLAMAKAQSFSLSWPL